MNTKGLTQQEQIAQAKRAYIVPLNAGAKSTSRWQVYLDFADGEPLSVLWPLDRPDGKRKSKDLLPAQTQYSGEAYDWPRFHFHLTG